MRMKSHYLLDRYIPVNCSNSVKLIQFFFRLSETSFPIHSFLQFSILIFDFCFLFLWRCDPTRVMVSSFLRFLDHTRRRTTVGRTPLDEWSARRRDLYPTTHNTHNRQTSMPPVGFEPTISAGERPQTYALDRAATGTGIWLLLNWIFCSWASLILNWQNVAYFAIPTVISTDFAIFNPLNPELNPICYLLALLAHHFLQVSRIRVKSLTFRRLMSYIYGAPILDVSRSHTTTQHSR